MFWKIVGIASLVWGGIAFFILSTTPVAASGDPALLPATEFTLYALSLSWLVASILVKVGLILDRRWLKVSAFSCICFVCLLINMSLLQDPSAEVNPEMMQPNLVYSVTAMWFVSWFWIDLTVLSFNWMRRRLKLD